MNIYIAHSKNFDFKKELYEPIRKSSLNDAHIFILPHEKTNETFNSKKYLKDECDLVIAEVSYPATGLGIELGWADIFEVPIACLTKKGAKLSQSLKAISDNFMRYSDSNELIHNIEKILDQ